MNARSTDIPFKLFGIFHGLAYTLVGILFLCGKLFIVEQTVFEIDLRCLSVDLRQAVGHEFGKTVCFRKRNLKHFCHILYCHFRCHSLVSDNMGNFFLSIFLGHVFKDLISSVIIKIDVYIRERDSVRIEKTFKEKVIFDRVYLGDSKTIGCSTSSGGSTTGTDAHSKFLSSCIDKILHDEKVSGKSHCLHYV